MANVNINRSVTDVFYRYKMPRLIAKVEGKGNGIKTVIVNMAEIAKALSRPPTYPTKYFGCELGAQTQFDVKNDRYIVNGSHESVRLQELLDGFIRKFVLCPECENPETNLTVKKNAQQIVQRCIACGHVANVDMRHKLTTFILKNPPEPDQTTGGGSESSSAAATTTPGKKTKRGKGSKEQENGNGDSNAERQTSHESNHSSSKRSSTNKADDDDDDDWCEDTSDAAVQARMEQLSGAVKNMTITEDLEKTEQERIDMFYSFVKQKKMIDGLTGADREKEIVTEAERLEVKDKAPLVLAELLYDANMLQQIKTYRSLFIRFTAENERAQRYLLGGFEQLVGNVHHDALMPKVPHILKAFYELDILDEEAILDWDKKASKKFLSKELCKEIHAKAAPFITWLNEAEEESSDGEEDGVEVVYSNSEAPGVKKVVSNDKPAAAGTTAVTNNGVSAPGGAGEDDDELNIDDI